MDDTAQPAALAEAMPFARAVGVVIERADAGEVVGSLAWHEDRCTAGGALHGGALMTLADSVGAVCAHLNLPPGTVTATIDATTCFLRPVRSGTVTAVARPLHSGRSVLVVRTELFDADGRMAAHTVQSQAVRPGTGPERSDP